MRPFLSALLIALLMVGACVPPLVLPDGADIACVDDSECVADDYCVTATGRCADRDGACADADHHGVVGDGSVCADDGICIDGACVASVCGDGFVDVDHEECDDGAANDDAAPDACRADCAAASCGDGVTDSGEACDGGVDCAACVTDCAKGSADCDVDGRNGCECAPARFAAFDVFNDEVCGIASAGDDVIAVVRSGERNGDPVPWRLLRLSAPGVSGTLREGANVNCPILLADASAAYVLGDDGVGVVVDLDGRDAARDFVHPCSDTSVGNCAAALGADSVFVAVLFPGDSVTSIDRAGLGSGVPFFTTGLVDIAAAHDARDRVVVALSSGAVAVVDHGVVAPVGTGFGGVPGVASDGDSLFVVEDQRLWRADLRTLAPILVDTLPPPSREGLNAQLTAAHAGRAVLRVPLGDGADTALVTWDDARGRAMLVNAGFPKAVVVNARGTVYADPDGIVVLAP